MNISDQDRSFVLFWLLIALFLTLSFGILDKTLQKEAVPIIEPGRMTDIVRKCYKVDLSPVIVRNDKGHVIDVFCKEKSNGSIQP